MGRGVSTKIRIVWYTTNFQSFNVPGEEGRILYLQEFKGILTVLHGNRLIAVNIGMGDMNIKTDVGTGHGVIEWTDRDGDKINWAWKGKGEGGPWFGPATIQKATGKFEGLKGKGTWTYYYIAENQAYADWDLDLEWSR